MLRARIRRLAAAGYLRVDEQRALDMTHAAGTGAVLALLVRPPDQRDPTLADAMFDALATGILVDEPAATDPSTATVAITFRSALPDLPALSDAERTLMAEWVDRSLVHLRAPEP